MARIIEKCPVCEKKAAITDEQKVGEIVLTTLACGHTFAGDAIQAGPESAYEAIESASGNKPFAYQVKTALFLEEAGFRAGIFHEQGLGKTICSLIPIAVFPDRLLPCAVLCKAGLTRQWAVQAKEWLNGKVRVQIIDNGHTRPEKSEACEELADLVENPEDAAGPNFYVISMDSLKSNPHLKNGIPWVKYVIIDECQAIKNISSKRTAAVQEFVRDKEQVVPLSGTPFKNNAKEYFPVLNILNPKMFYSETDYIRYHVASYWDGYRYKYGGLRRPEQFKEKTKNLIIRYTREEVMPDLPKIQRQFFFVDTVGGIQEEYDKELEHYSEVYDESEDKSIGTNHELRASLFKLWHLTGLAKIPNVADAAVEFLKENPDKRLIIFKHHDDVGKILKMRIDKAIKEDEELSETTNPCLTLDSDSPWRGTYSEISAKIHWVSEDPRDRVLIASTIAAGEGLNLQKCADIIMAERQWTPMNEEQCEGRCSRPGSTADHIFAQYFSAVGTIDDFFYPLVERKRRWFHEAMTGKKVEGEWQAEQSIMQELSEQLAKYGREKFSKEAYN